MADRKPNFRSWTLSELLLQPFIDGSTIEGQDFWYSVYARACRKAEVSLLSTPRADRWVKEGRYGSAGNE